MRRDRIVRAHLRTRFVVTLKAGETFDALLEDADASTLVLTDCWAVSESDRARVDGRLFVARADVAYMQVGATLRALGGGS